MSYPGDDITLADRHYVTLILRLTLDQMGHLLQGELVDTTDARPKRFMSTAGLYEVLMAWLHQQEIIDNNNS